MIDSTLSQHQEQWLLGRARTNIYMLPLTMIYMYIYNDKHGDNADHDADYDDSDDDDGDDDDDDDYDYDDYDYDDYDYETHT